MDPMLGVHQHLMVTPPLVQMEYLEKIQNNEYFPFKTVIIDDSLQNTLGEKKNTECHLETFDFITCMYSYYS